MTRWEEFANTAMRVILDHQLVLSLQNVDPERIAGNAAAIADALDTEYRKRFGFPLHHQGPGPR